jgi:hypothetical protein
VTTGERYVRVRGVDDSGVVLGTSRALEQQE